MFDEPKEREIIQVVASFFALYLSHHTSVEPQLVLDRAEKYEAWLTRKLSPVPPRRRVRTEAPESSS